MKDYLFDIELDSDHLKPLYVGELYGTSMIIAGIIKTKGKFIRTIKLKNLQIYGLINYSINDIINVERGIDPEFDPDTPDQEVIYIDVELKAFDSDKSLKSYSMESKEIEIKSGDYIHLRIRNEFEEPFVVNIDPDDDITYIKPSNWEEFCHTLAR